MPREPWMDQAGIKFYANYFVNNHCEDGNRMGQPTPKLKSPFMKKLEIIEFLKGYSIFTIIIYHYLQAAALPSPFDQLISFGGTGVHMFVLLSGFGLYLSYLHKPLPYLTYLRKRVSKIYIPYILVVLISAFISLFLPLFENSWYALGGHIFLYKMFDESIVTSYGYPLWFISMILQFYIAFYALVFIKRRLTKISFMAFCMILSIAWMSLVISIGESTSRVWNSFFLRYVWEFALGMVIAAIFIERHQNFPFQIKRIYIFLIGIAGCALYAFMALEAGSIGKMLNDFPALAGYGFIAIWIFLIDLRVVKRFFVFSGKISYALYLLHYVILYLLLPLNVVFPEIILIPAALALTYATATYYTQLMARMYATLKV